MKLDSAGRTGEGVYMKLVLSLAFMAAWLFTAPGYAHHAFAAVFNGEDEVQLTGTVTRLEWTNPHTWFYVDVHDEDGNAEEWSFEMGSPNGLIRRGWSRNTLQVGQRVKISGYRAKNGSTQASVKSVTLADGRELSGASSKGDAP
jgi:hypothetical protein